MEAVEECMQDISFSLTVDRGCNLHCLYFARAFLWLSCIWTRSARYDLSVGINMARTYRYHVSHCRWYFDTSLKRRDSFFPYQCHFMDKAGFLKLYFSSVFTSCASGCNLIVCIPPTQELVLIVATKAWGLVKIPRRDGPSPSRIRCQILIPI